MECQFWESSQKCRSGTQTHSNKGPKRRRIIIIMHYNFRCAISAWIRKSGRKVSHTHTHARIANTVDFLFWLRVLTADLFHRFGDISETRFQIYSLPFRPVPSFIYRIGPRCPNASVEARRAMPCSCQECMTVRASTLRRSSSCWSRREKFSLLFGC